MSVSRTAYAVLGVRVPYERLFKRVLEKVGEHEFTEETLFHPKTGKRLWEERDVTVVPLEAIWSIPGQPSDRITYVMDRPFYQRSGFCYVGYVHREGDRVTAYPESGLVESLKALLNGAGLWDITQFGVWAVLLED